MRIVNIIKIIILTAVFSAVSAASAFGFENIETEVSISWDSGDITITASAPVPADTVNLTSERLRISDKIDRNIHLIAADALDTLLFDSRFTAGEWLKENPARLSMFEDLNYKLRRISSNISTNLSTVKNIYSYNIFRDLMPIFIEYNRPEPVSATLNYEPTADFSGIIIYAMDPLPLYGENAMGNLQPAVFPKIYNEQMELVASAKMMPADELKKKGFIIYTDSFDEKKYEERIGLYPFRTTAKAIFGNNRTDVIISDEAAKKILYNGRNERLIREGRILVICNLKE